MTVRFVSSAMIGVLAAAQLGCDAWNFWRVVARNEVTGARLAAVTVTIDCPKGSVPPHAVPVDEVRLITDASGVASGAVVRGYTLPRSCLLSAVSPGFERKTAPIDDVCVNSAGACYDWVWSVSLVPGTN